MEYVDDWIETELHKYKLVRQRFSFHPCYELVAVTTRPSLPSKSVTYDCVTERMMWLIKLLHLETNGK